MKLVLKREALADLDEAALRAVAGGEATGLPCATKIATVCRLSDMAISLCECFSDYCSIDVC